MLSGYQYKLRYRPGTTNANADALSRLPLSVKPELTEDPSESVLSLHILEMTPARLSNNCTTSAVYRQRWTTGNCQASCVEWTAETPSFDITGIAGTS